MARRGWRGGGRVSRCVLGRGIHRDRIRRGKRWRRRLCVAAPEHAHRVVPERRARGRRGRGNDARRSDRGCGDNRGLRGGGDIAAATTHHLLLTLQRLVDEEDGVAPLRQDPSAPALVVHLAPRPRGPPRPQQLCVVANRLGDRSRPVARLEADHARLRGHAHPRRRAAPSRLHAAAHDRARQRGRAAAEVGRAGRCVGRRAHGAQRQHRALPELPAVAAAHRRGPRRRQRRRRARRRFLDEVDVGVVVRQHPPASAAAAAADLLPVTARLAGAHEHRFVRDAGGDDGAVDVRRKAHHTRGPGDAHPEAVCGGELRGQLARRRGRVGDVGARVAHESGCGAGRVEGGLGRCGGARVARRHRVEARGVGARERHVAQLLVLLAPPPGRGGCAALHVSRGWARAGGAATGAHRWGWWRGGEERRGEECNEVQIL
eukprot:Rhum_TRINITY_DN15092_c29_g1::Rhum_TRINITY_DN15092_c29_g1_i2::g.137912::m.137912